MDPEPGEEIFFHGHPSWRSILDFYFKGLMLAVLAGVIAGIVTAIAAGHVEVGWVIAVVLAAYLLVLALGLLRRVSTTYTITSRRLTIDRGIFSKELHQTRLERVQNVNTTQSLFERVLRVGTVNFDTAGEAGFDFAFVGVSDPKEIVRTVDRAIQERSDAGV